MTDGESLLGLDSLVKRYGGVLATDEVSFRVRAGEVLGLIGPNGAGKTTLVDLICGNQSPDGGRISLRGKKLSGPPSARARAGLARTFQYPQLAAELTAFDNVLLGRIKARMGGPVAMLRTALTSIVRPVRPADRAAVHQICDRVGVTEPSRPVAGLTLGEQRLVEVAKALAQEPDVLLLDEPFAGSDRAGEAGIRQAIAEVRASGHGVVLVDHNVDIVASLVDTVILLDTGSVAFSGTPQDCLDSDEMRAVYFGVDGADEGRDRPEAERMSEGRS